MKRYFQLMLIMIAATLAGYNTVNAGAVNQQSAQTIALNFFRLNARKVNSKTPVTVDLKYSRTETDGTVDFYVFDINPAHGFVIVSGDDNIVPVIAYSTESNFNGNFENTAVADWMNHASAHIYKALRQNIAADSRIKGLWSCYTEGINPLTAKSLPVAPLLTTTWSQQPFYNQLAPYNSNDQQRCMAGCVATAMAQIMKFWNFPAQGTGSYSYSDSRPMFTHSYGNQSANFGATTYNWAAMPNSIDTTNMDIATLMYHCAVSVAMDFGDSTEGGSGAYVLQADVAGWQHSAQSSYVKYFNYDGGALTGVYQSNYTSSDWLALMKSELNAGRPIQYEGEDLSFGGHTWVCDGYDANDMLHMNWGWGGVDNGYFSVASLSAGGMNFSNNEEALIGIQPVVPLNVAVKAGNANICAGDSTLLYGTTIANATYSWNPATGLSCPTCAVTMASPAVNTVYTLTIDSNGFKAERSLTISVRQGVEIQNLIGTNVSCYGGSNGAATATAIGGTSSLSYSWSTGQSSSSSVANLFAGAYSLTVSDATGCSASTFFSVSQPDSLSISILTQTTSISVYGDAVANVTGGTKNYSYLWNNNETTQAISHLTPGEYSLTVTDNNGCTQTASTLLNQTTAIDQVSETLLFSVYPNPAKENVTIQLTSVQSGGILSVKNALGQTLITKTISDIQNNMDLSQMAEGTYFVELKAGEKSFVKQIIVKK